MFHNLSSRIQLRTKNRDQNQLNVELNHYLNVDVNASESARFILSSELRLTRYNVRQVPNNLRPPFTIPAKNGTNPCFEIVLRDVQWSNLEDDLRTENPLF